jgi:hypothetical protein
MSNPPVPVRGTMTKEDLKGIVTYCERDTCGDPVSGLSRSTQYSKRQMVFAGFVYGFYAKYRCPKCHSTCFFRLSLFETHYVTKTSADIRREVRNVVVAALIVTLTLWGVDSVRNIRGDRARKAAQAKDSSRLAFASLMTKEFIETKPEFAEVYRESQVRVLFAAKIRSDAKAEPAVFVPPSAYFLDQDGNRYDPAVMLADKTDKVLDAPSPLLIVPGQVYRYYMIAPTYSNPYSDAPPSHTLTKLVVFLSGVAPQEVRLRKSQLREHAADEPDDDRSHFK